MREPAFWWREGGLAASLLAPAAACYGAIAAWRLARRGTQAGVPVLCVGNFTHGGTGKTPTVMLLAKLLQDASERPYCLSRGYGGSLTGPKQVDAHTDHAAEVGDEALLLARTAPTIVARNRAAGAAAACAAGATVIIMDDGLQNPSLAKNFTIAVVDGRRGIGNARVFPAGPLRAPLDAQLARTDALLVVGDTLGAADLVSAATARGLPVLHGRLVPDQGASIPFKGRKVLAFAGIGDPDRFFSSIAKSGIEIGQYARYPDHHRYTAEEAAALIMQAEHNGLALLTTEKDRVRMAGEPLLDALRTRAHVLPVSLSVNETDVLRRLVLATVQK